MSKVYIGCGAGFAGDRFDAAVPVVAALAKADGERFLIYEVLAERTLAIAQRLRRENPAQGYSPFLDIYLPLVLQEQRTIELASTTAGTTLHAMLVMSSPLFWHEAGNGTIELPRIGRLFGTEKNIRPFSEKSEQDYRQ